MRTIKTIAYIKAPMVSAKRKNKKQDKSINQDNPGVKYNSN